MAHIAVLGGGVAGLGAAYKFKNEGVDAVVYEKESFHGGHAISHFVEGFIYDDGPHVSFTKDTRVQELFAESVGQEYETVKASVNNYWKGHWIKHPVQCNLFSLPLDLKIDILEDFAKLQCQENSTIHNYKEWLCASYGQTFAENFPMEYTKKFHTTSAENMATDWVGPRLYKPDMREVLQGALSLETANVHYVPEFRYPKKGGFVSYLDLFAKFADVKLDHQVSSIDPAGRTISFSRGEVVSYDHIVSSIPLPDLIPMIKGVPDDVLQSSKKLACTTCVIVNVGLNRADISSAHWSYFYDQDISFTRLSFPHMQSVNNAPAGHGIIQAEVYFSNKYRPMSSPPEECIAPVIKDLKRCGLIRENDTVVFSDAKIIPYANVIFDLERSAAVSLIQEYLNEIGIQCCGRYGLWGYHWTDESFVSGESAAQRILDQISE